MKLIALTIIVLLVCPTASAQKQQEIARFRISEASSNGRDISQWYYERKQYLVFYRNEDGYLCFANVSGINNDQSYGMVYSLRHEKMAESDENYQTDFFLFRWKYFNSYDSKTGYANVYLAKIYKPNGIAFSLRMILSNLDELVIKGYMENSLNLNDYLGQ